MSLLSVKLRLITHYVNIIYTIPFLPMVHQEETFLIGITQAYEVVSYFQNRHIHTLWLEGYMNSENPINSGS